MGRGFILLALVAAAVGTLGWVPAAHAKRHVVVGIGEQTLSPLTDARFARTGIRTIRVVVPYNVVRAGGAQLRDVDTWLQTVRAYGIQPLVSFGRRHGRRGLRYLPGTREYARNVRAFRRRYPWVRLLATWNEANLPKTQPTGRHPLMAARYYRALRRLCHGSCKTLTPEFLATGTKRATAWLLAFKANAGPGSHIWAVHTYPDANRFRTFRTKSFLGLATPGPVWITETGGIVKFHRFHRNARRASRAVRHSFELARMSPRIRRIYIYDWVHSPWQKVWDSGLTTSSGRARPALGTLMRFVRHSPLFRTRGPRKTAPVLPPPPPPK